MSKTMYGLRCLKNGKPLSKLKY